MKLYMLRSYKKIIVFALLLIICNQNNIVGANALFYLKDTITEAKAVSQKLTFIEKVRIKEWRFLFSIFTLSGKIKKHTAPGLITEKKYGNHKDEKMDIIEPDSIISEQIPVLFLHSGGWVCGNKEMYYAPLNKLAKAGHRVFNVEYPLAPENPHPNILLSLFKALNWIRENYPNTKEVHLIGDSAGGNLVMMLGILTSNESLLKKYFPEIIYSGPNPKSIASIYGALDRETLVRGNFPSSQLFLKAYAGKEALNLSYTPETPITPLDFKINDIINLPPIFIAVGSKDKLAGSSAVANDFFKTKFKNVNYKIYKGSKHGFYPMGKGSQELQNDVMQFIKNN